MLWQVMNGLREGKTERILWKRRKSKCRIKKKARMQEKAKSEKLESWGYSQEARVNFERE